MATYYYYWDNGADLYYGYTFDSDGSQGLSLGYTYTATDETGAEGYYYVYRVSDENDGDLPEDRAAHASYYDGESGRTDDSPYYTATYGYALGLGMLGSYDYVDFGDDTYDAGLYGYYGYHEADDTPEAATFYYRWTNGSDVYYGYTYDSDGSQGLFEGYTYNTTDENGTAGYYYVYSVTLGNPYDLGEDQAYHQEYFDGESGQTEYDPYYSALYGYAQGSGMLGSYDLADFNDGNFTEALYGSYGYHEADDEQGDMTLGTTYYFYWTNGGDSYAGYTYDSDGSQGLYVGLTHDVTDENGYPSYYYVYSSSAGDYHGLGDDNVFHQWYYDHETDQTDNDPYHSYNFGATRGSGMTNSWDYVDFDDGDSSEGSYGSSTQYLAEDPGPGTTFYFAWDNGTDYFYGATYDEDGSQGLYEGYRYTATDETGATGFYYVYDSHDANRLGLQDDQARHTYYYDGESGQFDYDPYYSATYGYALGSGMTGSYDSVDFDNGAYDNGLYGYDGYHVAETSARADATYYYYWTSASDIYYGATYDADGSQQLYDGYISYARTENGVFGTYTVYSVESGNIYNLADDQAYHQYYYDADSGARDDNPLLTTTYGYAFGHGMLGSYDYVDFDNGGDYSQGLYGADGYYEAD